MKLFTKAIDDKLFEQYPLGSDLSSQVVVAKIFNPYSKGTWYLLNSDPQDSDYIWAIVDLFDVEMGSVSRSELEGMKVPPFRLGLERDTFFTPINALTLYQGLMQGKMYKDGGETKEDFLEDVREMHEDIAEITLKDGTKVSGEELMMYGHPKVIRTQFEDEEFEFGDGGTIKNQYEGRTPESIWDNLSKEQRQHFLYDHKEEIEDYRGEEFGTLSSKEIIKAYNSEYKDLDKNIRNRFDNHIREGQYANGGSLEDMQRKMEKTNLLIRAKIVNLIGLDETLNYLDKDFVVSPFRLLNVAVNRGLITVDDITVDLWDEAVSEAEQIDEMYRDSGLGISSSDMGYFVRSMLSNAGIEIKMADGGETDNNIEEIAESFVKKLNSIGIKATKRKTKNGVFVYGEKNEKGKYKYETYLSFEESPENAKDLLEIEEMEFKRLHKYAMGGETTFKEKIKAVKSSLLKRKKVSPKVQKDYGKTYSRKEAEESAKRIVGSQVAKWNEKMGKK